MSVDLYVDGSWNPRTPDYAGWAFAIFKGDDIIDYNSDTVESRSRQVDGELFATLAGLHALRDKISRLHTINLYYDYEGIEAWATGRWKAKSDVAKEYVHEIGLIPYMNKVVFHKVKSHTGQSDGNDLVDQMAKNALANIG